MHTNFVSFRDSWTFLKENNLLNCDKNCETVIRNMHTNFLCWWMNVLIFRRTALWIILLIIQVPFKLTCTMCFTGTSLLINNSAPQHLSGQVNGLAMMATAIGRWDLKILFYSNFHFIYLLYNIYHNKKYFSHSTLPE